MYLGWHFSSAIPLSQIHTPLGRCGERWHILLDELLKFRLRWIALVSGIVRESILRTGQLYVGYEVMVMAGRIVCLSGVDARYGLSKQIVLHREDHWSVSMLNLLCLLCLLCLLILLDEMLAVLDLIYLIFGYRLAR